MPDDSQPDDAFQSDEQALPEADWLRRLAEGESEVVAEFWDRYGGRMRAIADRNLSDKLRRRVDPDDVVQSACRTLFRRLKEGRFVLEDDDDLWRLICAITLNKARLQARHHGRQRRGVDRERSLDAGAGSPQLAGESQDPSDEAEWADFLRQTMGLLSEEQAQIVELKLAGHTNAEIAKELSTSLRTVGRLIAGIRDKLKTVFDSALEP